MSDPKRNLRPAWGKGNGAGIAYGSKGTGWGGEARGAGSMAEPAAPFAEGNTVAAGPHDLTNAARLNALKDMLYSIGLHEPNAATRVSAIQAYLNRVEGMPTQRQELTGKDGAPMVQVYLPSNGRDVAE